MSVVKCQEIVDILEAMLLDAQLIYSGNKNSVIRMKKAYMFTNYTDVNTLRKLIREGQTELAEIGTSSSDPQLAPISSLLDNVGMNSVPRLFPFSPSLTRSYYHSFAQPSLSSAQLELQKRHVAPILPSVSSAQHSKPTTTTTQREGTSSSETIVLN